LTDEPVIVKINGVFSKWALGIFASLILLFIGWGITTVSEHRERLVDLMQFRATTEATRFTTSDAAVLQRELQAYHESRTPPPEVLLQLQNIDKRIADIEAHINNHNH